MFSAIEGVCKVGKKMDLENNRTLFNTNHIFINKKKKKQKYLQVVCLLKSFKKMYSDCRLVRTKEKRTSPTKRKNDVLQYLVIVKATTQSFNFSPDILVLAEKLTS